MLKPLGLEKLPLKKLYSSSESEIIATKYFDSLSLPHATKIVGISVTAGNKVKEWGTENFTKLIKMLLARFPNIHIVLIGLKNDMPTIESVRASVQTNQLSVLCPSGLNELTAHMKHFNLFISVDTGPMHVADALQIPLIDIIGPVDRNELTPRGAHVHIVEPTPIVLATIFAFKDAGDPILTRKALDQTSPEAVFVVAEKILTKTQ